MSIIIAFALYAYSVYGDKEIDYIELDRKIAGILNLTQGCVFVLTVHRDGRSLEFVYPPEFKGNVFPIDGKSIVGRTVVARRSYISNNVPQERGFILLDWFMNRGGTPIQKEITCPVILSDKVVAVLQITRRGASLSESGPDFRREDLEKIKSVLDDFVIPHTVKSAGGE